MDKAEERLGICKINSIRMCYKIKRKDLTNIKFGHLTVLEMLYNYENKHKTHCRCICDCGNEHIILADHIQKRNNPSCGCMSSYYRTIHNRSNEIGNKYGYLTIIDIDCLQDGSVAICKCDCGKTVRCNKADIISGHTLSCGCLQRKRASNANQKDFSGYRSQSGVIIKERAYKKLKGESGVWYWKCICPLCGNDFIALPAKVISNHTTSCGCKISSSKKRFIENYMMANNVRYEKQKRFADCKYKYTLPFDFAIYDNNNKLMCLIEYDGQQHYKSVDFFGGEESFRNTQIRDQIKTKYCIENNIPLLRLNYAQKDNEINQILTNIIYP